MNSDVNYDGNLKEKKNKVEAPDPDWDVSNRNPERTLRRPTEPDDSTDLKAHQNPSTMEKKPKTGW